MKTWITLGALLLLFFAFFRGWMSANPLSAGDWSYVYPETIKNLPLIPRAWDAQYGGGMGGNDVFLLPLNSYFSVTGALLGRIGADWQFIERVVWYLPVVLISIIGAYIFSGLFVTLRRFRLISSLVYTTNTYILMLLGGGQVGVAMGYAFVPLSLWSFMKLWDSSGEKIRITNIVGAGLLFALQLMFDQRIAYITLLAVGILFAVHAVRGNSRHLLRELLAIGGAGTVTLLLHLFWLVPFSVIGTNPLLVLGEEFVNASMVKYLSFAPFEHTLSLLHPNWPENVFGKISFLQPEFLAIPLIAFASLIFISKIKSHSVRIRILGLALVGLIGAFLSKGTRMPLEDIYLWLFENFPGFVMLRDSSKFYALTAVSYSVLIAVTLSELSHSIKFRPHLSWGKMAGFFITVFVLIWMSLNREAVLGVLTGTFAPIAVPYEYKQLHDYFGTQNSFSRVLWIPARQRFGHISDTHPAVTISDFKNASASAIYAWLIKPETQEVLSRSGVSHIVVPTDPKGELFLTDRKYDGSKREQLINAVASTGLFWKLDDFGNIAVFKTGVFPRHAFLEGEPTFPVEIRKRQSTEYELTLSGFTGRRRLVFSESFDPFWRLELADGRILMPAKTPDGLQSYDIDGTGSTVNARLHYVLQPLVMNFFGVSTVVALIAVGYILYHAIADRKRYLERKSDRNDI